MFRHLTHEDLKRVIELEVSQVRNRLSERGFQLELTDAAKEYLIKVACKDLDFGARPLRRAIENRVEDPLAEELLKGTFRGNNKIFVDAILDDEGKVRRIDFRGETVEASEPAAPAEGATEALAAAK